jgi:anti-sigma factor RsiW
MMSCDSVSRLVPLYVEDDLPSRRAEAMRSHLGGCLSCRALLEGYRASQRSLHGMRRPEIGGAALDDLRRTVWRRIRALPPRSAVGRRVDQIWVSLRAWASQPAMAALVIFAVVGGSFALSRVTEPGTVSSVRPGPLGRSRMAEAPRNDEVVAVDPAAADDEAPEPNLALAQADFDEGGETPDPDSVEGGPGGDDSLRIEIQTPDPDVRIIWFSPTEDHAAGVED